MPKKDSIAIEKPDKPKLSDNDISQLGRELIANGGQSPRITITPISKIKFRKDNPRLHSDQNLELIGNSIKRNKAGRSILIDEKNQALAGEGTTRAAMEAGIKEVLIVEATGDQLVAVRRTDLTEDQKQEMILLDNRTNETSEWDQKKTAVMLAKLAEAGVGLDTFAFTEADLEHFRLNGGFDNDDFNKFFTPNPDHGKSDPTKFHLNLIFDMKAGQAVVAALKEIDESPEKAIIELIEQSKKWSDD